MHLPVPLSSMHLPNRMVLIYVYVSDGYKGGYTSPLMLGAYQVPAWRDDKLISHFGIQTLRVPVWEYIPIISNVYVTRTA